MLIGKLNIIIQLFGCNFQEIAKVLLGNYHLLTMKFADLENEVLPK